MHAARRTTTALLAAGALAATLAGATLAPGRDAAAATTTSPWSGNLLAAPAWNVVDGTALAGTGGTATVTATLSSTVILTSGTGPATWTWGVPDATYRVTADVRALTTPVSVGAALVFYDRNGVKLDTVFGQRLPDTTTGPTTVRAVGIAPAGTAYVNVGLLWDAALGNQQVVSAPDLVGTKHAPAAITAPLHTSGNGIYDATGRRLVLRGIVRPGTERGAAHAPTDAEVAQARRWGANIVRIFLNEALWLPSSCAYDPSYAATIDRAVSSVTSRDMVALVDLHWNTTSPCGQQGQQQMADYPNSVDFWTSVANRYKGNGLVAFDLYNEPHGISDQVWRDGGPVTTGTVTWQAAGMQQLYDAVRRTGASNLVFVSGNSWANKWPSTAPLAAKDVVYAVHAYTCPQAPPPTGPCYAANPYDPSSYLDPWVAPGQTYPVAVTEFGWPDAHDGRYNANVIAFAERQGWSWTAFAWDGGTSGTFDVLQDLDTRYNPLPAGMPMLAGLQQNQH